MEAKNARAGRVPLAVTKRNRILLPYGKGKFGVYV